MSSTVTKLHQQYGQQINFVMLDIDNPQWARQVEYYRATGIPQFSLLDSSGQSVDTWVGKVPSSILAETLKTVIETRS